MNNNHKWRVNVYLGKERYQTLEGLAKTLRTPLPQLVRALVETGYQFAEMAGGKTDGKQ